MWCSECVEASREGRRLLGMNYFTFCERHREEAANLYQSVKPSRSKSNTDYRKREGRS